MRPWSLALGVALLSLGLANASVEAQEDPEAADEAPPPVPDPDPTRLDVERLPPEAVEVTRELYAHGLFVEAWLGGRGFVGGAGPLTDPGPLLVVGVGYELLDFLWVHLAFEASIHQTSAPAPPTGTAFDILGGVVDVRLQVNPTALFAMWIAAEAALHWATGDVLQAYGVDASNRAGLAYGGSLGLDFHLANRHTSLGVVGGARLYPALADPLTDDPAVGVHAAAYLRYVFAL